MEKSKPIDFEELAKRYGNIRNISDKRVKISLPNAREVFDEMMTHFVKEKCSGIYRWTSEYQPVVDWLSDNKGRGLFLYGACGTGKTLIGYYVIPSILFYYFSLVVSVFSATQINVAPEKVLEKHILSIDDVGTEGISTIWGNKRMILPEVLDMAEKQGNLVIYTTNLDKDALIEKYDYRTFDRIISTTVRVKFSGKSLRN